MYIMRLWCTIIFAFVIHIVRGLSFVKQPKSQNVSEGTEAVFNCTAHSLASYWLINNEQPHHETNENRGLVVKPDRIIDKNSNLKEFILIVPGSIANSGITITCSIYSFLPPITSSPVTLLVQGLLNTVSNLQAVQLNSSSLTISYTPPNTLDGVPIRNYSIEISIPSNNTYKRKYSTTAENITIPVHNPCYEYLINVSAWNDVGQGNSTSITTRVYEVPYPPVVSSSRVSVRFLSDSVSTTILHTKVLNDCLGKAPENITVILNPLNEQLPNVTITSLCALDTLSCDNKLFSLTNSLEEGKVDVKINLTVHVAHGLHYSTIVLFSNRKGSSVSPAIELNTFRITAAEVTNATKVCLKCTFADGDLTEGCLGVFVDRNRKLVNQSIIVPAKLGILCFLQFPPGDYDVLVYDNQRRENLAFDLRLVVQEPGSRNVNTLPTATSSSSNFPIYRSTKTTTSSYKLSVSVYSDNVNDEEKNTGSLTGMSILVLALSVSSASLVMLLIVIVSLTACLMKYKKKNNKLKIAEISALQRQRSAEIFLHSLTISPSSPNGYIQNEVTSAYPYYETPTFPCVNPLYENMEEIQLGEATSNNLQMTDCPAYVKMPTKL